jgi:hypothetical protein
LGQIEDQRLPEISGIAVSGKTDSLLWVLNDNCNSPTLYALNFQGRVLGSVLIAGVDNIDWEDMAGFNLGNTSYLLIGDVGDNQGTRPHCYIHIIEEPSLFDLKRSGELVIQPVCTMQFKYPDGSRDCESIAVDVTQNKIYMLSKRAKPPVLYELPLLLADPDSTLIARRLGQVRTIPLPKRAEIIAKKLNETAVWPTSMAFSKSAAVILTYDNAYYYTKNENACWISALSEHPQIIELPYIPQAESVCFSPDEQYIFIISERLPSPIYRIRLNANN